MVVDISQVPVAATHDPAGCVDCQLKVPVPVFTAYHVKFAFVTFASAGLKANAAETPNTIAIIAIFNFNFFILKAVFKSKSSKNFND